MLAQALVQCREERVTGAVRFAGNAGGLVHLRDGAVVAVDSPGSPGVETLLVRSGRIGEEDWTAALAESVEVRSLRQALVGRGVGAADVEAVALAALFDGAFAVVAGEVAGWEVGDELALLPVAEGLAPEVVLGEVARLLDEVAAVPVPVAPYRDRVVPVGGLGGMSAERRELVAWADGRRTVRDLAFAVGWRLQPVTVEVGLMLAEGLVEPAASLSFTHWGLESLGPRV